ncbi:substrate-binding domain-containing protein [Paenactinomyces guangxiensis]|uniref:Substrate-binding domain-containing protein n=1 Tax=Paenactinomyces guangxiensis TaxID=1490290 RepID=A0A7W1WRX7_9BACL|nr:substrate-binding domain-containing protein [Paenactinomyces guangxiensis]MBH8591970.1 substrate-binding domain-containing protein [Paenactinomyces guangxiensis]
MTAPLKLFQLSPSYCPIYLKIYIIIIPKYYYVSYKYLSSFNTRLKHSFITKNWNRRIAYFSGPRHISTARERVQAYINILKLNNLPVDPLFIIETNYKLDGGKEAATQLLKQPKRPTAFFAANNLVAIDALHHHGLRVPEDICGLF